MYEDLAKLVYDYSCAGKRADADFLVKVIEVITEEMGLELNELVIDDNFDAPKKVIKNMVAAYCYSENSIWVDSNCFGDDQVLATMYSNVKHLLKGDLILLNNIFWVETLLHELEHAYQFTELDKDSDDIENKLINFDLGEVWRQHIANRLDYHKENGKFLAAIISIYKINFEILLGKKKLVDTRVKYYDYIFTERMAELRSHGCTLQILELLFEREKTNKEELDIIKILELKELNDVYRDRYWFRDKFIPSPTFLYLEHLPGKKLLEGLDIYDKDPTKALEIAREKYDLGTRLFYGLPVSREEYDNDDKIHLILKKHLGERKCTKN